ncbi:MAG: hypothetical protein RRC07_10950 [Anaerolineae bacterium]|nr:hypothetical protein [Anaerolineae bacterium]
MMRRFQRLGLIVVLLGLASCQTANTGAMPVTATPDTALTRPITQSFGGSKYPLARSLIPGELNRAPEDVRTDFEEGQQQAARDMPRLSEAGFMGPVFIPTNAIEFHKDWVHWMQVAPGERLAGYLGMASNQQGSEALVTLLVDYQQIHFYLGGKLAEAHLLRLPVGEYTLFEFALAETLSPGVHDLVFMVNVDPFNSSITRGVVEKQRRDGNASFSTAGGYLRDKALALRRMVVVGDGATPSPISGQNILAFNPENTDLLNSPLFLSLVRDETDPIFGEEPALVAGEDDELHAFVYYDSAPPEQLLPETKAALFAFLDGKQVPLNGQPAILWEVEAGQRYHIPLQVELPPDSNDGAIHSLNVGVVFGALEDWRIHEPQERWMGIYSFVAMESTVPVVPERALVNYIWSRPDNQ